MVRRGPKLHAVLFSPRRNLAQGKCSSQRTIVMDSIRCAEQRYKCLDIGIVLPSPLQFLPSPIIISGDDL